MSRSHAQPLLALAALVLLATAADVNNEQLLSFDKIIVTDKALEQLAARTNS